ncbi:aspartate/methionine/tyrosine aminotransferase [Mycolicibacterium fluoranthenivorans]|uniref:Aminotransferase n=1 Tax=Mycolicibacterium fluoranthenivorans TaxID=258505 RepID=A0A7X5TY65_9MYCO|nr:pyridoxal phosphate-dependent aminotransferase [Mycolicibacterium fluoranthenivorans]MCV7355893.1 pyridoxal phosphate-dependent aminotransferase [Mycolicibacterium fluoranthenivorans]NIH94892.1 aspartate/methionine/tyrosine aminotransferase [Mycolicibacterium fluoranthenivorans]
MRTPLSNRVAGIRPSATLAIDARAKALAAAGEPVVNFGAGEPDFATPAHIVTAAVAACTRRSSHSYSPAGGLPELREAVCEKTRRDSGLSMMPEQVLVTNGGKQAVYEALAALVDVGDEVIIPAPFWTTYPEIVHMFGGSPVVIPTDDTTGFKVSVSQLDDAHSSRTKVLIFCSPSNPTGAVYTPDEVRAIGQWCLDNDVWVLTDEIYEHLYYGASVPASMPVLVPDLADRCVVINGVSKAYAMTGWRVGWLLGPPDIVRGATALQSHATSNVANVSQYAALAALTGDQTCVGDMRSAFHRRRDVIVEMLSATHGVDCPTPEGAFYAFASVKRLLGTVIAGRRVRSSAELADVILDEVRVAATPGEAFGSPGYLRFSYALCDADLTSGIGRLQHLLVDQPA